MDLSFPQGNAVNSGVSKFQYRGRQVQLRLPNIDDLIKIVQSKTGRVLLFKRDLKSTYKQVYVCVTEIHLLGYIYNGKYYFDVTLPMGLTNSAYICQRVTDMLIFIYHSEGYTGLNYLDDLASAEVEALAMQAYEVLGDILSCAGVQESAEKASPPSTRMVFLGMLLDTLLMRVELTPDRLKDVACELQKWDKWHKVSLKQVQRLVGKLNFCASAVQAGRLFFSRILNFLRSFNKQQAEMLVIPTTVRKDIEWWGTCLKSFNGISKIPEPKWVGPNKLFSVDECKDALGGWAGGQFFHCKIPQNILENPVVGINELELLGIMIVLKLWGHQVAGQKFLVQCDNQVAVQVLNSGAARNEFSQQVLREICYITMLNNSCVRDIYLPANFNRIADILSRWHSMPNSKQKFEKITAGIAKTQVMVLIQFFCFSNKW